MGPEAEDVSCSGRLQESPDNGLIARVARRLWWRAVSDASTPTRRGVTGIASEATPRAAKESLPRSTF